MTPRKSSQKKWTAIPSEFREKAAQVFAQNFRKESEKGAFVIDGRIFPEEIVMRAGYLEQGRLRQTNFEVSLDYSVKLSDDSAKKPSDTSRRGANVMDKLFLAIDVLGSVFETHFEHVQEEEAEEVEYPVSWEEYDFDDSKVYLRFSTVNTALEEAADRILGQESRMLFNDAAEFESEVASTDALAQATIDTELAHEVSRAIREGRFKPQGHEAIEENPNDLH